MADSSDQSSGFWTLTRPSKLSKKRTNSDLHELHHKVFNISVVGLSGVEKDKGPIGIGKSCLCNRFVRSAADDYHTDHISVLSQSDFSGRVVNNDHWLYWGSVIKSCDGYDLAFNIIEQSEFVDDACFQPFKSGKTEPYFKRCANTKLVSAEKLMYICKSQLGIEREYEQRYLPDGKFNVDGFLCLFDVSGVQGRNIDKQIEMTNLIMLNLIKTRKPIVFVTTKHDEASELLVAEAERLVNQRDFRGLVPIVETSAQENVNINMAFLVCAQLIDKTRAKLRVPPYYEAYRNHLDLLNAASEAYLNLIRSNVVDYRSSWQQVCIKLSHNPEFLQYTYLHGLDKAAAVFKNHLKRLHEECIGQKVQIYLKVFPDILNELVPQSGSTTTGTVNNSSNNNNGSPEVLSTKYNQTKPLPQAWELAKEQLRSHPLFNKYFVQIPTGISWFDTELLQSADNRIPSDWLDSEEAYLIFQQRNILLETEQKRQLTRDMFAQMLSKIGVPVGKPFIELKHIFAGNTNLEILSDQELFEVYVEYQNNLLQQARADFQELLLENAEHLHHLTSSNKVIRQEDIKTINAILQHDERYQALDRFDQDRTLMMIRHLSFLHSQISEQCPSYPKCVEPEVERLLITKAKTLVSRYFENKHNNESHKSSATGLPYPQKTCDLVIFGPRRPSQQLILALNVLNSRAPKVSQYQITFTVFDNPEEVDSQIQRFRQSNTKPRGCFGIFTNRRSLEHVGYTLEKFLILSSNIQNDKNHFGSPPIVMLYAADITLDERTVLALENEGQQMADRFKCPFMNVTAIDQYRQHQQNNILSNDQDSTSQVMSECASLDYACVDAAFNVLKEAVSRRVCFMELYNNQDLIPRQAFNPDARILMCLLCGEPFSNELFMWRMFLNFDECYVTSSKSICLKIKLDSGIEKFVEITITSYTHGAFNYREDLLHGFILVCSIQRKASLSILNAFSFNIPCTPVLVMAIKKDKAGSNGSTNSSSNIISDNQLDDEESHALIKEAQSAAKRLKGHFELLDLGNDHDQSNSNKGDNNNDGVAYSLNKIRNFLHNVIKRKPVIEKAYELGDSDIPLATSSANDNSNDFLSSKKTLTQPTRHITVKPPLPLVPNQALSSDEDIIDEPLVDKHSSDNDSDGYLNISESAPPKPVRLYRPPDRGTKELNPSFNELYATRPLPPIPCEGADLDRDVEPASTCLPGTNQPTTRPHHGNMGSNVGSDSKLTKLPAASEDSSTSDNDDTEDSASDNKQSSDKPKPGKLDLSQFDNITNAIGKLNVQPSLKSIVETSGSAVQAHSKVFQQQIDTNQQQDTSGFFKNRTRKAKTRSKESTPQRVVATGNSSVSSSSSNAVTPAIVSPSLPTIAGAVGSASVTGLPKRLTNPRHNHGRAVAPPQLPGAAKTPSSISRLDSEPSANSTADTPQSVQNESVMQLTAAATGSDGAIDFSQSPIAQRLLNKQHSKDYKVSEINSPYESDNEPSLQSMNYLRNQRIYRGQTLDNSEQNSPTSKFINSSIDSSELINSRGAAIRQLNEILANKQPPGRPGGSKHLASRSSSLDQELEQQPLSLSKSATGNKKTDSKKDKKKLRDDEKLEKRRLKEEERLRRQEKKAGKKSKSGSAGLGGSSVGDDGVPLFIKKCIEFIEFEGLDAEGIYRVPGNRAHVDAFVQKFNDNPDMSIVESDIPVNAVATALKDFLSKKWGPIIPLNLMNELTELSNISEKEQRVHAVRQLIHKLPATNYRLLKYVFSHFVKVSLNHSLNSMDSKNLAICWWPTLLPLHFSDMVMFEQMRPHLEESIQTMIDQYDFIFDTEDPTSNVA